MKLERDLEWNGCFNARDLGGLRTRDGRQTRWGVLVRADGLERLTSKGWAALESHGVRTIIDLRNDDEIGTDSSPRPRAITKVLVPMDDVADTEFWEHVRSNDLTEARSITLLFLERKPEQCVAVVSAIAQAGTPRVVFHCGRGRDRTGLVTILVLSLVGVVPEEIASDYELSTERVRRLDAVLGEPNQGSVIAEILSRKQTSARSLILELLQSVDVEGRLRSGGLADRDVSALRARLVGSAD
jgi:protein-tyrosine phosphatase